MSNSQRNRSAARGTSRAAGAAAALLKRFQAGEQQAIDALARWIWHPAVRPVIERRRIGAETVVLPISRLLTDQEQVARFSWHLYGIAGVGADWELRRGEPWMLTPAEMDAIERVESDLRGIVQMTVNELAGAHVGLVPSWLGDHAVVAELLLLDIPWDLPARELAANLNPPPIGAIHIDASGIEVRRGTWERAESNITSLRRSYEQHLYGPAPRAPYADGGTRAIPESTSRRREALRRVLKQWPDATASRIWTTFGDHTLQRGGQARTPGGYLRQLLEDPRPGETVTRPSKSTLHADLKVLREASED